MQKRQLVFNIQGIAQDVLKPEVNSKFAYSIQNMRLTATKDSSLLSLTTEKGTLGLSTVEWVDGTPPTHSAAAPLVGTFLGACILQNSLVLFTHDNNASLNPDRIYRLFFYDYGSGDTDISQNRISYTLLYMGDLNFRLTNPIEAIASYENEKVQKVYWIDGLNQPRVINIINSYIDSNFPYQTTNYTYDPFSFTQEVNLSTQGNSISVTKQFYGGLFNAGVVQYAYCYFRANMQESNIVEFTPLYYVSFADRGEEPGKQVSCSFEIEITSNAEDAKNFDYIRVFQIYSTSLDATPNVKIIKDIDTSILNDDNLYKYKFVDSNEFQIDASQYEIQLVKQFIIPQTIVSKDDTLFLGNFKSNFVVDKTDLSSLNSQPQFVVDNGRHLKIDDSSENLNVYKYKNQLDKSSRQIKTFKYGEHYKFGVQFQNKYGQWSEPYFLADVTNYEHVADYNSATGLVEAPYASMSVSDIYNTIMAGSNQEEKEYIKVRPVISFPTQNERLVLCQGVINPTVFNFTERFNGTTYAQASWFFRPYPNPDWSGNTAYKSDNGLPDPNTVWFENGATCQFKHFHPLMSSDDIGGELQNMYFDSVGQQSTMSFSQLLSRTVNDMSVRQEVKDYLAGPTGFFVSRPDIFDNAFNSDWRTGKLYTTDFELPGSDNVWSLRIKVLERAGDFIKYRMSIFAPVVMVMHIRIDSGTVNNNQVAKRPELTATDLGSVPNAQAIYQNYYFVDQSVATLNSPEIEFDSEVQNADLSQYNIRIVGYIPMSSNTGNYKIVAGTPLFKMNQLYPDGWRRGVYLPTGEYKKPWQLTINKNAFSGHSMLCAWNCWFDDINGVFLYDGENNTGWNDKSTEVSYYVYPWQRQYLNNYNHNTLNYNGTLDDNFSIEDIESSKIQRKILANLRFSENSKYFDSSNIYPLNTGEPELFSYDQDISLKLESDKFYKGNVDQLVVTTSNYYSTQFSGIAVNGQPQFVGGDVQGYPIVVGTVYNEDSETNIDAAITYSEPRLLCGDEQDEYHYTPNCSSIDPILVRYKSVPHVVFNMEQTIGGKEGATYLQQNILPIGVPGKSTASSQVWDESVDWFSGEELLWNSDSFEKVEQDTIPIDTDRGYLWIGEIYRELKAGQPDPFTDNNDDFSLRQRDWVVAGESVDFNSSAILKWFEGDTFYQRYDCLKTYPLSEEDYQSVVEILSFMCETRINLDGRYDKNRGLLDNTLVNGTNFNQLNLVYNQRNNFFTYNILDSDIFKANKFGNQITWTLPKLNGAKIDNWTKITLAATADADGGKGEINALRKYRDSIYCFQTNGIGRVLYNERVQISTSDGTPIEIGNSQKFQGLDYISDIIGCQNKWACKETPSGIYFVDNNTPGIYITAEADKNGTIRPQSLSKQKYMQSWFETRNVGYFGSWNIQYPTNCWINYDSSTDEVLITDPSVCLTYSPQLNFFTGFYSYNNIPSILSLEKYPLAITSDSKIYRLREGAYSKFFSDIQYQPYGLTLTAYPYAENTFIRDCIYDNLWYKGDGFNSQDVYQPNEHFDYLRSWNEYQDSGINSDLVYTNSTNHINTNLRKKFRLWYAKIPRNYSRTTSHTDRMRNPWLRLQLYKSNPNGNAIRLQELMVDCFF